MIFLPFLAKSIFRRVKNKKMFKMLKNNDQIFGLMSCLTDLEELYLQKYFMQTILRIKEVIWTRMFFFELVKWSKYDTFSPIQYYFQDSTK